MSDSIDSFFAEWPAVERARDTTTKLEELFADDFVSIGPLGFSVPKLASIALRFKSFRCKEADSDLR